MGVALFITAAKAKEIGCTHHAMLFGLIPGFVNPENFLWVSRSDLLNPIEDFVAFMWATLRQLRGEEPDFMCAVGRQI